MRVSPVYSTNPPPEELTVMTASGAALGTARTAPTSPARLITTRRLTFSGSGGAAPFWCAGRWWVLAPQQRILRQCIRAMMKATDSRPNANAAANVSGLYGPEPAAAAAINPNDGVGNDEDVVVTVLGAGEGVAVMALDGDEDVGVPVLGGREGVAVDNGEKVGVTVLGAGEGVAVDNGEDVGVPVLGAGEGVALPEEEAVGVPVLDDVGVCEAVADGELEDVALPEDEAVEVAVPDDVAVDVWVAVAELDGDDDDEGDADADGIGVGQPARQLLAGLPVSSMLLVFNSGCCAAVNAAQWMKVRDGLLPTYKCVRYAAPSKSCSSMDVRPLAVRSTVSMPGMVSRSEVASKDRLPGAAPDRTPKLDRLASPHIPPQLMQVSNGSPAKLWAAMTNAPLLTMFSVSRCGSTRALDARALVVSARVCRPRRAEVEKVCPSVGPEPGCVGSVMAPSSKVRIEGFMPAVLASLNIVVKVSARASTSGMVPVLAVIMRKNK